VIAMLDTSEDLSVAQEELGATVEQLLTPLTRFSRQDKGVRFAIDNGAFSGFNANGFRSLLDREWDARSLCRFVVAPDVVASAIRTREVFDIWKPKLAGWPVAYVVQDGQESVSIPWGEVAAIFIGGSTAFKMGPVARACISAAQCAEKWVHAGRVNTPGRWEYFEALGADSIDGSGLSRFSWMREKIYAAHIRPSMFEEQVIP